MQSDMQRFDQLNSTHTSASFTAKVSVRLPRKPFIFIIPKKSFLDQSIGEVVYSPLKTEALAHACMQDRMMQYTI